MGDINVVNRMLCIIMTYNCLILPEIISIPKLKIGVTIVCEILVHNLMKIKCILYWNVHDLNKTYIMHPLKFVIDGVELA